MFWHIVSIRRSYMISESLWQGIIMDKTIQNMAKIREEIQSRNQEKKYDVNEMPEVAQMILEDTNSKRASDECCMSIKEILHLIPGTAATVKK